VSCVQREVFACVVDLAHFVWVDVGVCFGVGGEGVGRPGAFPESV
jgi:bacteriorhodopsin